jgi:hypothetical protein
MLRRHDRARQSRVIPVARTTALPRNMRAFAVKQSSKVDMASPSRGLVLTRGLTLHFAYSDGALEIAA